VWQDGNRAAFALTNNIAQPVLGQECYILVGAGADVAETDLFDGIA
jgi:N-acetyl-1-D-myo-inositol-2-amino-2-deoxy-alpha-D-glucopyranoside deacetylase